MLKDASAPVSAPSAGAARTALCRASPHKGGGWPWASAAAPWYRRRAKARQQAALAQATAAREAVLDRLQWQLAELRASLERAAVAHEAMRAELAASICDFVTFRN
jgi:hypothetical protein